MLRLTSFSEQLLVFFANEPKSRPLYYNSASRLISHYKSQTHGNVFILHDIISKRVTWNRTLSCAVFPTWILYRKYCIRNYNDKCGTYIILWSHHGSAYIMTKSWDTVVKILKNDCVMTGSEYMMKLIFQMLSLCCKPYDLVTIPLVACEGYCLLIHRLCITTMSHPALQYLM